MLLRRAASKTFGRVLRQRNLIREFAQKGQDEEQQQQQQNEDDKDREAENNEDNDEEYGEYEKDEDDKPFFTPGRIIFWSAMSVYGYNYYLNLKKDIPEDYIGYIGGVARLAESNHQFFLGMRKFLFEPPTTKILPDISIPPEVVELRKPRTILVKLEDLLINTDQSFGKGQEIKLRPYLNQVLQALTQNFEVIILSKHRSDEAKMIMSKLNPQLIESVYGSEYAGFNWGKPGESILNLEHFNRDLRKLIVLDLQSSTYPKHEDNVIVVKRFEGDASDEELAKVMLLLNYLSQPHIKDVREYIKAFGENPIDEYIRRLKESRSRPQAKVSRGIFGISSPTLQK